MRTGVVKKLLCSACLCLPVVLATVGRGQTAVGASQGGTASVLDRVQRENDPELSELIRIAVTNRKDISDKEILEIVRRVTQSHAQIKLLDQQIEQVTRKLRSATGPVEMQSELVLAKAELESKRTTELANLRELMGVTPKFPLSPQLMSTLNAWVYLNVIGERVYVLDTLKPFSQYWADNGWKSGGLLSERETLDYLRERLKDRSNLPIRINFLHTAAMNTAAEDLRAKIASLVKETNSEMDTEVRPEVLTWTTSGRSPFFVREGKIRTFYPAPVRRPAGGPNRLSTGLVAPNDIEQHILWRLLFPGNVPFKFLIEYDQASAELAKQVADTAKAAAKRLGISELVEVAGTLVEPVPETVFLGRWQTPGKADFQTIDVQPTGVCLLTTGTGSESSKAEATVSCPWTLATKEIFIDSSRLITYRAYVGAEGNLFVDKGKIWPPGSWHAAGVQPPTIYKKVQ